MNILMIDTTESGKIKVSLEMAGDRFEKEISQKFGSQVLLNLIEEIIGEAGLRLRGRSDSRRFRLQDLDKVEVKTGPGSYTGTRIGVAVANTLGFGLGIPVNGKDMETELIYK